MHFHLPKPLHGWREFAGEVGIIVLGVLIALTAEQVVESWHWRRVVAAERVALDDDVADMWNAMSARMVMQPCVDERLSELQTVFDRHNRGQPLGIVGPIGRPSVWSAHTTALQIATADESLSHMPAQAKRDYFGVYAEYPEFERDAFEERGSWRTLELLNDPQVLDEADWRDLRRAYRDAVDSNRLMKSNLLSGRSPFWLVPFAPFRRMAENKKALTDDVVQELCRGAVRK